MTARTNLGPEISPFVGRTAELERLERGCGPGAAGEGGLRGGLVRTIVGPGGAGKTRLAREYAAARVRAGDEVWFVALGATRGARAVAAAVADPLGAAGALDPAAAVAELLVDRRALIVLDNVEHVAPAVADLVVRWRAAAPGCEWLATGRSALEVPGEEQVELGPLTPEVARELFVVRAAAARRGLGPRDDPDEVARLVQRLDHLPLGVELAAAWADRLSVADLLDTTSALSDRQRDPRHGSLDAVVAWSWDHLDPPARADLQAMAAFRGAWDLQAAAAVLAASPPEALPRVDRLRGASLLRTIERADGTPGFVLYEGVRAFVERGPGVPPAAAERLATWLTDRAESDQDAHGDALRDSIRAAARDRDDLLALIERDHDPARVGRALLRIALRAPAAMAHAELLERVDAVSAQLGDHPLRARLAAAAGLRERWAGRLARALDRLAEARERAPGTRLAVQATVYAAVARSELGQLDEARRELQGALATAPDGPWRASVLNGLGSLALTARDLPLASEVLPAAIAGAEAAGAWQLATHARVHLAQSWWLAGDLDRARDALIAALPDLDRAGDPSASAWGRTVLAGLLLAQERVDEALLHLQDGLRFASASGDPLRVAIHHRTLALVDQAAGRLPEALAHLAAAEVRLGQNATILVTVQGIRAEVLLEAGDLDGAQRALERGLALAYEPLAIDKLRAWRGALRIRRGRVAEGVADLQPNGAAEAELLLAAADLAHGRLEAARARVERAPAGATRRLVARWVAETTGWRIGPGATWFEVDGRRVDLGKRALLARLLLHLAERRLAAPGEPQPPEVLIEVGWPGERIQPEAAANRLYVAVSTLRKLGLAERLERVEGGWRLDPTAAVERA